MAKLDFPICLIDESVVDYGFRVLMSGARLDNFKKNPVLLIQHERIGGSGLLKGAQLTDNAVLPLGKWCDFEIKDGQLLAVPEFDDDDAFAVKVEGKVKKGYLNGASIWIEPITVSDDEALKLPGQMGPTITEWGVREASIVDIPNCRNALAIRTEKGKISLSGSTPDDGVLDYLKTFLPHEKSNTDMDKKVLALKLGLPETASDAEVAEKLAGVLTTAGNAATLNTEVTSLKGEVLSLRKEAGEKRITDLVDGGLAAKKYPEADRAKYLKLAAADFDTTKSLIDGLPAYESIESKLAAANAENSLELGELMKLSGDQLYMKGLLDRLKAISEPSFKLKYKEAFGVEYPTS